MKVFNVVLGLVVIVVLSTGWQKGSKAEEGTEAVKEIPDAAVPAPVAEEAPETEATAPVITAPIATESTVPVVTPADATETVPALEVTDPVTSIPAHNDIIENEEESSPAILSVAELFAKKAELNGKKVTVFGSVVKVNLGIMGKNWIHLQDGTGTQGTNDITVATEDKANVDDKVVISGTVATDKDFGDGYKYSIIIENATIKAQ